MSQLPFRIGTGFDVHQLVAGRALVMGGVTIPYERGLLGHSDADVLLHAIADALLGAVALGDIGKHFPDNDPAYKGADSRVLLRSVVARVRDRRTLRGRAEPTAPAALRIARFGRSRARTASLRPTVRGRGSGRARVGTRRAGSPPKDRCRCGSHTG